MMDHRLSRLAFALGISGLLPQLLVLALQLHAPHAALAQFSGFLYAALILSFLGGLWWGVAAVAPNPPRWLFAVSVLPSLVAFGAGLIWISQSGSPTISLQIVGIALTMSPLIDWQLERLRLVPRDWMTMRLILSIGLGLMTLMLARQA